ncbi:MAG TPA: ATP-dependent DNA helicase [Candidatus Acidoferrales bacterium]|nr:ATP-dependent DNA helicase [Candidatus Acidoferrales bacterium]
MSREVLEAFWASGASLRQAIPGYQIRPSQVEMSRWVQQALEDGQTRVIEAGTGIGKTFAYLAPVLLGSQRVLISTATLALQDQLMDRDLPTLQDALGIRREVALLKGRGRYLCRYRFLQSEQDLWFSDRAALGRIRPWMEQTRSGDLSECATLSDAPDLITRITSSGDNCLGQECPEVRSCHVLKARRAAMDAEVVVVNHHLLFADMALREDGFGELLPGVDAIVMDEAHQLRDVASQFFGSSVSTRQMGLLLRDLRTELAVLGDNQPDLLQAAETVDHQARLLRGCLPDGDQRIAYPSDGQLPDAFAGQRERLQGALQLLASELDRVADRSPGLHHLMRRTRHLGESLAQWGSEQADRQQVHWLQTARNALLFHSTPLEVGAALREFRDRRPCPWILTSATLTVGKSFSDFLRDAGLDEGTPCLKLASPFDYAQQALTYVPAGLPLPSAPDYDARFIAAVRPVLEWSEGRAFLLFTSHRALRLAATALADLPFPVLTQGDAPPARLLERFVAAGNAVLLGAASFWAGVDVRGEALQLVAIDRLPFAAPDDPVLRARLKSAENRGGNPFREVQLPAAVMALRQGAGRLIRDAHDRGVLLVGDRRLLERSYGRVFLDSLPPAPLTRDAERVAAFFRALRVHDGEGIDAPAGD